MLVGRSTFHFLLDRLLDLKDIACDTETTGLRAYHGDRLFSIILANENGPLYFNFFPYPMMEQEYVLGREHLDGLKSLFACKNKLWYLQNAPFDMHMLHQEGIEIAGTIHCTKANGRVEWSDWFKYSLELQLERIGDKKIDAVKKYVEQHKLWTEIPVPGKKEPYEHHHYERVPFDIMQPYGEQDGMGTFKLGRHQVQSITNQDTNPDKPSPPGRTVQNVMQNERRLTHTIYRMERVGVRVDIPYCKRAQAFETDRQLKHKAEFKKLTGRDFVDSAKCFEPIFQSDKEKFEFTDKGNPSFSSDVLSGFTHPAAKEILGLRDAKSKADFYNGFLFHADAHGDVHPNFDPGGTVHGRFSSSQPNFQNLTSEEDEETLAQEFVVRRALIPRPGFIFIMPDYDQMEYRFMLEMACQLLKRETPLVTKIKGGLDVHAALVELVRELGGLSIDRKVAKVANFLTLYGGGPGKLAGQLNISLEMAHRIRNVIFQAAPEIKNYIDSISFTARERGYIINWLGRRCQFPNTRFAYKAANYHVSGGCADIVKVAMNRIDQQLLAYKSRLVMTVHDELPIEVHESESHVVPGLVHEIMQNVFTSKYLPITAGMEWSSKSLGDKIKGFPI